MSPDCPGGVFSPWYVTLEHLLPRGAEGYDASVAVAHLICNEVRAILPAAKFGAFLEGPELAALYCRTFGSGRITMRRAQIKGLLRGLARWGAPGSSSLEGPTPPVA